MIILYLGQLQGVKVQDYKNSHLGGENVLWWTNHCSLLFDSSANFDIDAKHSILTITFQCLERIKNEH